MKKLRLLIVLSCIVASTHAQTPLESLVNAEKSFAQTSVDKNVREAFITFMDDASIAFRQGEPINGRPDWEKREPDNVYLFWWPVWADISSAGDLGYTTGPAEFGDDRSKKVANGGVYYSSVWRKDKNGVWKIAADLGSATYKPGSVGTEWKTTAKPLKPVKGKVDVAKEREELLRRDRDYIAVLNKDQKSFAPEYLSIEARIHRGRRDPLTTPDAIAGLSEQAKFQLEQVGGDIASSGDLGYTYGKVKAEVVRDGKTQTIPVSFMRVWKKEEGGWKIVLDVIGS